jgi:hypothetical protein
VIEIQKLASICRDIINHSRILAHHENGGKTWKRWESERPCNAPGNWKPRKREISKRTAGQAESFRFIKKGAVTNQRIMPIVITILCVPDSMVPEKTSMDGRMVAKSAMHPRRLNSIFIVLSLENVFSG